MCVAAIQPHGAKPPSKADLLSMERQNPHGAGVAWPQYNSDGVVVIAYRKGLDHKEVHKILTEMYEQKVGPVLFHFRWSTVGGVNPLLCHPFPVEEHPHLAKEGEASEVLIHNGHWSDYEGIMKSNPGLFDPKEKIWSDTRVGAHLLSMGLIKQGDMGGKVARMGSDMVVHKTGYWTDHEGLLYSNMNWQRTYQVWTPKPSRSGHGGKKGSPMIDADEREYRDWWMEAMARDTPPTGTKIRSKGGPQRTPEVWDYRQCLMCDVWVSKFRCLTARGKDDQEYVVCRECDWETPEVTSLLDRTRESVSKVGSPSIASERLFTDEELAAKPMRTINGVPHVQAPTGEWHPVKEG